MPSRKEVKPKIRAIQREISSFGSVRIALREFRRLTGRPDIDKLTKLRSYLSTLPDEALDPIYLGIKLRLGNMSYPRPF